MIDRETQGKICLAGDKCGGGPKEELEEWRGSHRLSIRRMDELNIYFIVFFLIGKTENPEVFEPFFVQHPKFLRRRY